MEKAFWIERWEKQETGFHQSDVNAFLKEFWPETGCKGGEVLVPLCGKSNDMLWLKEQGHDVLGVELSGIAVAEFFRDNGLKPAQEKQGAFESFAAGGFHLLNGDFFALQREDVKNVKAVYDRAALIALPKDMRERYAAHMAEILPENTPMLLVTLSYPQRQMDGPPFSVDAAEVERLYGARADIRVLTQQDSLAHNPHLQSRGLDALSENAFLLTLKP